MPHQLNSLVMGNRKAMFSLLFDAASYALLQFAKDEKYLGAQPGIIAVLHIPLTGQAMGSAAKLSSACALYSKWRWNYLTPGPSPKGEGGKTHASLERSTESKT